MEIERQYFNKRDNEGNRDFILYNRFMQTSVDAGIVWACSWIGDVYFEGIIIDVDYIKASEYYEKGRQGLFVLLRSSLICVRF